MSWHLRVHLEFFGKEIFTPMDYILAGETIRKAFDSVAQLFEHAAIRDDELRGIQLLLQRKLFLTWGRVAGLQGEEHDGLNLKADVYRAHLTMAALGQCLQDFRASDAGVEGTRSLIDILSEIQLLVEDLYTPIDEDQAKLASRLIASTFRKTVVEVDDVHTLRRMIEAVTATKNSSDHTYKTFSAWTTLVYLLQLKEMKLASEEIIRTKDNQSLVDDYLEEVGARVSLVNRDEIGGSFRPVRPELKGKFDPQRDLGTFPHKSGKEAWIEWRTTERNRGLGAYNEAMVRTVALAQVLSLPSPRLSVPECVGFVKHSSSEDRCAWIFRMPPGSDKATPCMTLHSMLCRNGKQRPSLNERTALALRLASTMLHLHTADWLHQAFHSGNVLFPVVNGEPDLDSPIVSGFEYSRPYKESIRPDGLDQKWNIYRYLRIQSEVPRAKTASKMHDIYSLGLVLLEVAYWKPLHELMKLKRWPDPSEQQSLRIQGWLLGEERFPPFGEENPLTELRKIVGDKYWRATLYCLQAGSVSSVDLHPRPAPAASDTTLHTGFETRVLDVLADIVV